VFVFGGMEIVELPSTSTSVVPQPSNLTLRFDPATRTSQELAPLPTPVGGAAAVAVGDFIYVIGGTNGKDYLGQVLRYDPQANTWSSNFAPMSVARAWASAAVINGEIYVIGGELHGTFGPSATDSLEIYNPESNSWRSGPEMPSSRKDAGIVQIFGDLYVIGGYDGKALTATEVLR
jgi:kelch-like protein 20